MRRIIGTATLSPHILLYHYVAISIRNYMFFGRFEQVPRRSKWYVMLGAMHTDRASGFDPDQKVHSIILTRS